MSVAEDETHLPSDLAPQSGVGKVPTYSSGNADPVPVNYYGGDVTDRYEFPDGVQWVEVKEFTEGDRRKYLMAINKDIRVERQSGNAYLHNTAGVDRYELLQIAIIDWNLYKPDSEGKMNLVKYNQHELRIFLQQGKPSLFEKIELKVRALNPWLMQDLTIEQIDEQIEQLQETKEIMLREEAGKES